MRLICILVILAGAARGGVEHFDRRVEQLLSQKGCQGGAFSIKIIDAATSEVFYQRDSDKVLTPASNLKLVTTAAGIKRLGYDYAFTTVFGRRDKDLVIIGSGDPLLGDPVIAEEKGLKIDTVLAQLVEVLRQKNITIIEGNLLLDDTIFDDVRYHPSWPADQAINWYAAQISGLNFNNNCLDVSVKPGGQGRAGIVSLSPATYYVELENKTKTVASGKNTCWASWAKKYKTLSLRGNVRSAQTLYVTVDRPSAFFGMVVAEYLSQHGIAIRGELRVLRLRDNQGKMPADMEPLLLYKTPLEAVMCRANQRSLNLAAECLLKHIGAQWSKEKKEPLVQGTWANGRASVEAFLQELGCLEGSFKLDDGCGLSHENRLSATVLVKVMHYVYQSGYFERFLTTMAQPGAGTLQRRFRQNLGGLQDRLYAKTGYVNGAWALSGYYQRSSGQWVIFSILANRKSGGSLRAVIDDIVAAFPLLEE